MSEVHTLDQSYVWHGRVDSEDGAKAIRWHDKLNGNTPSKEMALIGYCCDEGVKNNKGRLGAQHGPNAIRDALRNYAWHGHKSIDDLGNVLFKQRLNDFQDVYADYVASALKDYSQLVAIGGGHDIALGDFLGLQRYLSKHNASQNIGIINFDAHFDLREPNPTASSGTPFYQIAKYCENHQQAFNYACLGVAQTANTQALFERADDLGVRYVLDKHCTLENIKASVTPLLSSIDHLYVTVCLDVFSADISPGVSAPSSLGIAPNVILQTLEWLQLQQTHLNYQWKLTDIAEMNPKYDQDNRTARLAARLISEVLC